MPLSEIPLYISFFAKTRLFFAALQLLPVHLKPCLFHGASSDFLLNTDNKNRAFYENYYFDIQDRPIDSLLQNETS